MNSPSPSSSSSMQAMQSPSILESLNANRVPNEHGLEAFLARAEIAKVTRALRARLSYASYKAANNLAHVPFDALEQLQEARARRSSAPPTHDASFSSTSTDDSSGALGSPRPRTQSQMMPPPGMPSLYSSLIAKDSQTASKAKSPPLKRSRRSPPNHHATVGSPTPTRSKSKSKSARTKSPTRTSSRRKKARAASPGARSVASSSRSTHGPSNGDVDMDDGDNTTELDLNAAAALTSLLNANANSSTANNSSGSSASVPHSPTPSHASSFTEAASISHGLTSYSRGRSLVSQGTMSSASGLLSPRMAMSGVSPNNGGAVGVAGPGNGLNMDPSTPKPAADNDVAEMMIYLATSPSPARPARPQERTLLTRGTGRVLFPTTFGGTFDDDGHVNEGVTPPRGTETGSGYGIGEAGPSRHPIYSLSSLDSSSRLMPDELARPSTRSATGRSESGHIRAATAPEGIFHGSYLHNPPSPTLSATVYSQSQGFSQPESQDTVVDADGDYASRGAIMGAKGKGITTGALHADSRYPSMRGVSPSLDSSGLASDDPGYRGYLPSDPRFNSYLEAPVSLNKARRPSPIPHLYTPPEYETGIHGYMSDVRGGNDLDNR